MEEVLERYLNRWSPPLAASGPDFKEGSAFMKQKLWLIAVCVGVICTCFNSTSIASPEGLAALTRAQSQLRISFMECAMKLRLYSLSDERGQGKKLGDAVNCLSHLKSAVAAAANSYKKTNSSAYAQKRIEIWQNEYSEIIDLAIKRQTEGGMPEKILGLINFSDEIVLDRLKDAEVSKKSFADKVIESDKWPDGSPIVPTNPDLEQSPTPKK